MYDDENNSLDFKYNGDYSEEPRGAYLSTTSGYDLSNGFTFEFFGNLRNIEQKQDKVTYDAGMGLFCLGPNIWKDSGKVLGFGYNKSGLFANMGPSSAHWCGDVYVGPYGGTVAKGLKFPAGEDVYITITYQVGEGV